MADSEIGSAVRNQLREEYFSLLPKIRLLAGRVETEIRYHIRDISSDLEPYEQVVVKSRIKDCESAIRKLAGEGNFFVPGKEYSLRQLNDLAGVRVLVFPSKRLAQIDEAVRNSGPFRGWERDSHFGLTTSGSKYCGLVEEVSPDIRGEYQIVPMLIGSFWEVEHSAMYKPARWAKGADRDEDLKTLRSKIERSLADFEQRFEEFVAENRQSESHPADY